MFTFFECVSLLYPRKNISHIILCNFSLFLHFVLFCAFQPIYVYVVCITTILTLFFVRIILSISSYMFLKYVLKCFLRRWEYKFCTRSDNIHLKEISIEKGYFNGEVRVAHENTLSNGWKPFWRQRFSFKIFIKNKMSKCRIKKTFA